MKKITLLADFQSSTILEILEQLMKNIFGIFLFQIYNMLEFLLYKDKVK